ncbi:MAG: FkbM family methyltransferase [Verrucomicrobia bacterium]|nr:MAG: FkbM family methyltransferase [Verrucomicrobiota bacterium]
MKFERLIPPALLWRLQKKSRAAHETRLFSELYGIFLKPGDLCFDIGANLGNRVRSFVKLGCRVVALEPQAYCFSLLQKEFSGQSDVVLIQQAVGRETGEREIHVSRDHVLSSFSQEFIQQTTASGRFAQSSWNETQMCQMTTMDQLIENYGMPRFVKIDVEGFEPEVVSGLTQAVPALSIEWVPEMPHNARRCIEHLASLGDYEYCVSWAETMKLSAKGWRSKESILRLIDEFAGETFLFGDIYARVRKGEG